MLLIEEEAKTKWCFAARWKFAATDYSQPCNRDGGPANLETGLPASNPWLRDGTRCIASACMAWRSAGWRDKGDGTVSKNPRLADPAYAVPVGYCGLAGAP